jgi:GNAT superfamily N-acetyltransferase
MTESPPLLRRARPDEAGAITDLALRSKRLWGYSDEFMAVAAPEMAVTPEDIAADHVEVLASETGLIGFLRLQRHPDEAWLEDLFIDPGLVRSGHGRLLFEHAAQVARDWGYATMRLESDPHAESFYLGLGAERVGPSASTLLPDRDLPLMSYRL